MTTDIKPPLSSFERMAAINVNEHVEKKNGLSYLSWAWAVDQLMRADPNAQWAYNDPVMYGETMMVSCTVGAFGINRTMHLPVMDYKNRAIANPDAFAVNTAMQRCLVKAIALHGLGLYIYAGEDLPLGEEAPKNPNNPFPAPITGQGVNQEEFDKLDAEAKDFVCGHARAILQIFAGKGDVFGYVEKQGFDQETLLALWSQLPSNVRSAIKKAKAEMNPPHQKEAA